MRTLGEKMSLTPTLGSIEALFRKMEREFYRAYHQKNRIHKADHLYNFCVTAHSMRDFYFERLGLVDKRDRGRQPLTDNWNKNEFIIAVSEIANSSKHFILRDQRTSKIKKPKTRKLRQTSSTFANVYQSDDGEIKVIPEEAPDCTITLKNGTKHDLYTFMQAVIDYWREFLMKNGVPIRKQPLKNIIGDTS